VPDKVPPVLLRLPSPAIVLAADWAGKRKKRSVWIADIVERTIRRCHTPDGWTLRSLLRDATKLEHRGSVLVAVDAVIGVPAAYFARRGEIPGWEGSVNFIHWLAVAARSPQFFEACKEASAWSLTQPFFAIPKGAGARRDFVGAAGFDFLRRIDRCTKANPLFVVNGIPGTVGSATREIWRELSELLQPERAFRVWPFEGRIEKLLDEAPVVLAEMYPRLTYEMAIDPALRPPWSKKTHKACRSAWVEALRNAPWITEEGVTIADLQYAIATEDDFDALFTAAALLRRILEGAPLAAEPIDPIAEGGILLYESIASPDVGFPKLPLPARK